MKKEKLPHSWAVRRTKENHAVVNKFFNEFYRGTGKSYISDGHCRVGGMPQDHDFIHYPERSNGSTVGKQVEPGYTEISYGDFREYVMEDPLYKRYRLRDLVGTKTGVIFHTKENYQRMAKELGFTLVESPNTLVNLEEVFARFDDSNLSNHHYQQRWNGIAWGIESDYTLIDISQVIFPSEETDEKPAVRLIGYSLNSVIKSKEDWESFLGCTLDTVPSLQPVYTKVFAEGDLVVIVKDFYHNKSRRYDGKLATFVRYNEKSGSLYPYIVNIAPFESNTNERPVHDIRLATPEEIAAAQGITIAGYRSEVKGDGKLHFGCQSVSKQTIEELVSISRQVRVELTIGGNKVDGEMLKKIFALFP